MQTNRGKGVSRERYPYQIRNDTEKEVLEPKWPRILLVIAFRPEGQKPLKAIELLFEFRLPRKKQTPWEGFPLYAVFFFNLP